jgi:hypothetical protein
MSVHSSGIVLVTVSVRARLSTPYPAVPELILARVQIRDTYWHGTERASISHESETRASITSSRTPARRAGVRELVILARVSDS